MNILIRIYNYVSTVEKFITNIRCVELRQNENEKLNTKEIRDSLRAFSI